jgi:hypothetical protein
LASTQPAEPAPTTIKSNSCVVAKTFPLGSFSLHDEMMGFAAPYPFYAEHYARHVDVFL